MKLNKEDLPPTDGEWTYGKWSAGRCWCSVLDKCLHNSLGPALIYDDGAKDWRVNGRRHRLDGPAVERVNCHHEWWVDGLRYLQKDFASAVIKFLFAFDDNTFSQIIINEINCCVADDNVDV